MAFNPIIPPTPKAADIDAVLALARLAADPAAAADFLAKLNSSAADARETIAAAKREQDAIDDKKADAAEEIANLRETHDQHLATSRAALEAETAKRKAELDAREDELKTREVILKEDEADVAKLKADLQRRLAVLKNLASD